MNQQLVSLAIQELPNIIKYLKTVAAKHGQPDPTNEQVIAAYRQAITDSLEKDRQWLASNPEEPAGDPAPEPAAETPEPAQ